MVIPWIGFPLARLDQAVEPTANAKFVEFTTLLRSRRRCRAARCQHSGLAVRRRPAHGRGHESADAARVGLYGKTLPNQNGAPIRLVVPWKYGFKGVKSIVQDPLHRQAAADHLERCGAERIRLLLQREPEGRSSALEPGDRAPHRRVPSRRRRR